MKSPILWRIVDALSYNTECILTVLLKSPLGNALIVSRLDMAEADLVALRCTGRSLHIDDALFSDWQFFVESFSVL